MPETRTTDPGEDPVEALVVAFYRGLGADATSVTATIRRRDMAIGRQLVASGATPEEAQAYASETSQNQSRVAPVDLRSFERERLGWLGAPALRGTGYGTLRRSHRAARRLGATALQHRLDPCGRAQAGTATPHCT